MMITADDQHRVVVLTRPNCHLCEEALAIVDVVCSEVGASWVERDINDDPDLLRRYTDQVPVIFVDGDQHDYWRVDPVRLHSALGS